MTAQAILLMPTSQSATPTPTATTTATAAQTATATFTPTPMPTVAAVLAVSPGAATFTAKLGGKSREVNIVAANQGKTAITLTGARVTGNFQLSKACGGALSPNKKCTYSVVFVPAAKGMSTGSLTIDNNGSSGPRTVSLSGTGQ